MNKSDAGKLAEIITNEQLKDMFERAKKSNIDWEARSKVNPGISNGAAWNILYRCFDNGEKIHILAKRNMIWAFGDYLDESLKPAARKKIKQDIPLHHEEPDFLKTQKES